MNDLEVVLIDGVEYFIIKEAKKGNVSYLYLSNVNDYEDTLIRKVNKDDADMMLPLESEEEFEIACNLFLKELFAD